MPTFAIDQLVLWHGGLCASFAECFALLSCYAWSHCQQYCGLRKGHEYYYLYSCRAVVWQWRHFWDCNCCFTMSTGARTIQQHCPGSAVPTSKGEQDLFQSGLCYIWRNWVEMSKLCLMLSPKKSSNVDIALLVTCLWFMPKTVNWPKYMTHFSTTCPLTCRGHR